MIRYLKGNLLYKEENNVVLENNGIGYKVYVHINSEAYTKDKNDVVELYISMIVREDDISLFGFDTRDELELFEKLITVNGVGAKAGLSIFSALSENEIKFAILKDDVALLTRANGIGKKTAQRIILDLKDKVENFEDVKIEKKKESKDDLRIEVVSALETMGFLKKDIENTIDAMEIEPNITVEKYITLVLKNLAKN